MHQSLSKTCSMAVETHAEYSSLSHIKQCEHIVSWCLSRESSHCSSQLYMTTRSASAHAKSYAAIDITSRKHLFDLVCDNRFEEMCRSLNVYSGVKNYPELLCLAVRSSGSMYLQAIGVSPEYFHYQVWLTWRFVHFSDLLLVLSSSSTWTQNKNIGLLIMLSMLVHCRGCICCLCLRPAQQRLGQYLIRC